LSSSFFLFVPSVPLPPPSDSSQRLREASVICLGAMTRLPYSTIQRFKQSVGMLGEGRGKGEGKSERRGKGG
jgi:hypothetical protein